jgi:outer membrane protein TolC
VSTHPCFAACLIVVTLTAAAQTAGQPARATLLDPELDEMVAEALANAPETAVARASVEAAQRRIVPARTLADPFVSITYQNDGRNVSFGSA